MLWDSIKLPEKNSQGAASRRTPFDAADCDGIVSEVCCRVLSLSLTRSIHQGIKWSCCYKKEETQPSRPRHFKSHHISNPNPVFLFLSLDAQQPFSCVYQGAGISTRCRVVKNISCLSPTIYYEIYSAHKRQASREILARQPHTLTRRRDAGEKNRAEIYGCDFFLLLY